MAATSSRDTATAALLESLPPAMQDEILPRLPIRDAAHTSALSRAWRRRWETVPYRFLDWPLRVPADTIDHVLAHCTYPVRKFRHPHVARPDFGRFDLLLLRLAAVGVRSISVGFEDAHMLHSCIFSCGELATLDLVGCDIPAPPPCFVGLPNLTTLILSQVGFPHGVRGGWHFSGLPFLEVADISGSPGYDRVDDFLNLISGLDQARELKLCLPLTWKAALEGLPPSFENLKNLSLETQFHYPSSILNILCVIRNAPKLEVFEIELMYPYTVEEVGINYLYAQCADDLFSNVTNFRLKNAMCVGNEMVFIELVLSKGRRLEAFDMYLYLYSVQDLLTTHWLRLHSMEELLQELMSSSGISSMQHN